MIKRITTLAAFGLLTVWAPAQPGAPNFIVILADDLGYGDLSCYGSTKIHTPNIDRLAAEGVRLTQFYANAPECTPTRTAFLTGRYQQRVGGLECAIGLGNVGRYDHSMALAEMHQLGLDPQFSVLPGALKEKGYQTAVIGKWHLGYEPHFRPLKHGFDYAIGPLGGGADYFHHVEDVDTIRVNDLTGGHTLVRNDREVFRDGYYMNHLIRDEARSWLNRQSAGRPFFLYIPFTCPHNPLQGPDDYSDSPLPAEKWRVRNEEAYRAMIEDMDRGIGEILAMLERKGLAGNTLVIFFSDNGPTRTGSAGGLRGFKGGVYEGGIRVPCLIRWPGNLESGRVSAQVSIGFDLTASMLHLAGVETESLQLDGMDLVEHLIAGKDPLPRTLFWRKRRGARTYKAVRHQDYKYLIVLDDGRVREEHLSDLSADPSEQTDLREINPSLLKDMKRKLSGWESQMEPAWLRQQSVLNAP